MVKITSLTLFTVIFLIIKPPIIEKVMMGFVTGCNSLLIVQIFSGVKFVVLSEYFNMAGADFRITLNHPLKLEWL